MFNLIHIKMSNLNLDLKQVIKSGVIGTANTPFIAFKLGTSNKCAFNFTGVTPNEGECLGEFLDRTMSDLTMEEWTEVNENGESHPHKNFTVRLSFN